MGTIVEMRRHLVGEGQVLGSAQGVLLHTVAGAELRGSVVDEFNAPVANAEIFVTPSLTGSVDKTVLEAMSCARVALTCNESFAGVFGGLWLRRQNWKGARKAPAAVR